MDPPLSQRYRLMKKSLALVLLVLLGTVSTASAQYKPWQGANVLEDPAWRASFVGSYGFLSGAEPEIRQDELLMLREILELISTNPRAAIVRLEAQAGEDSSAALDFILANLKFQNGDLEQAQEYYESALSKFPDFRRAHKNLGLLRIQNKDFAGALEHLPRALELGDRDGKTYGLMGYCHINLENHFEAEVAYRNAILQEPEVRDWKLGLARALQAMKRDRDAISLFETLIDENPDDPSLWLLQSNSYVGVDEPMNAAVNLEAVRLMGSAQASSLKLLGDIYMNEGMYDLAKDAYLDVIEGDVGGGRFETAYRAADLLLRARSYDEAGQILASIDKRYGNKLPQDEELQVLTLKAKLARARGRDQEAAELLESIVERDGTRGDALLELAAYHHDRGDSARALMLVERAQNLKAFEYTALIAHAQYRVADREYRKAAELLRRALVLKREPRVERFLARIEEAARSS